MATPERNPAPRDPAYALNRLGWQCRVAASAGSGVDEAFCVAGLRDLARLGVAGSMVAMPSRPASVALAGHALATRAGVNARPPADGSVRVLSATPGGLRTCPVSAEPADATAVNGASAAHDRATTAGAQPGRTAVSQPLQPFPVPPDGGLGFTEVLDPPAEVAMTHESGEQREQASIRR